MEPIDTKRALIYATALVSCACAFDTRPIHAHPELVAPETIASSGEAAHAPLFDNSAPGTAMSATNVTPAPVVMPGPTNALDAASPPAPLLDGGAQPSDATRPEHDGAVDELIDAAPSVVDAAPHAIDSGGPGIPTKPLPGTMFTACESTTDCAEGLVCTSAITVVVPPATTVMGYCTAVCPWVNGSGAECPQPSSGTVRSSCQLGTMLCLLGSCEHGQCPEGLSCEDTQTPIGGGQVVHAYACNP
jgi:hypothetical protein